MTNALTKNTRASAPRPTTSGTPGTPGYWSVERRTVCSFTSTGTEMVVDEGGVHYRAKQLPGGGQIVSVPTGYLCSVVDVPVYVEAVQATTGSSGTPNLGLGWDGGARSQGFLAGDGYFEFTIQQAVGVVAGLNDVDAGTTPNEIEHGIYFSQASGFRILESGVTKTATAPFDTGDVFRIRRAGGVVQYLQNGEVVYTSAAPSTGTVLLDVSLYAAGDGVSDPSYGTESTAALQLPALGGRGGEGTMESVAAMILPALTLASTWISSGIGAAPAMRIFAGEGVHAEAALTLPALTLASVSGAPTPGYAIADLYAPRLTLGAVGLTGGIGGVEADLPALAIFAGEGTGRGSLSRSLPALTLTSYNYEGNGNASMGSTAAASSTMAGQIILVVVMNSDAQVDSVMTVQLAAAASMQSTADFSATQTTQLDRVATMMSTVAFRGMTRQSSSVEDTGRDDGFAVWAVDLDSAASSMYEHYDFNSFADLGGVSYGAKTAGVYLLEGERDAGSYIRASADFGRHNFGTNLEKRVPYVYVGVASDGRLMLRVSTDGGASYDYYTAAGGDQQVRRFELGKGLRGSYFHFELFNVQGSGIDLDTIEFAPLPMSRRI